MTEDGIHDISRLIKCDCYSHAIEVEYTSYDCPECYINMWYDGNRSNTPFVDRAKAAFDMLSRGYVIDGFVLNREKVIQLRDALSEVEKIMAEDEKKVEVRRKDESKGS